MRKKRTPVNTKSSLIRYRASSWFRRNKSSPFTVPFLTEQLGLNREKSKDVNLVYRDVICYWRKKAIKSFIDIKKQGGFPKGKTRNEIWDIFLRNLNQNDIYVFLFDHDCGYYVQPNFSELENLDRTRLIKQWKGIKTVLDEMDIYDARVLLDSKPKKVEELRDTGEKFDKALLQGKKEVDLNGN